MPKKDFLPKIEETVKSEQETVEECAAFYALLLDVAGAIHGQGFDVELSYTLKRPCAVQHGKIKFSKSGLHDE